MTTNRVKQTTTSTSTAVLTLAAVGPEFRTFATAPGIGVSVRDVHVGPDSAGAWLMGTYTVTDANTLTRTAITDSSNGGADVTLAAGVKDVFATLSSERIDGFLSTSDSDVTAFANLAVDSLPVIVGGLKRRMTLANFLATLGQTAAQLDAAGTLLATDVTTVFRGGSELRTTIADLAAAVAAINGVPDTTKPQLVSAVVANAARTEIVLTFNETLGAFTPATSAFAVPGGKTITGIARSGATVTLTVNSAYAYGDSGNVSYTKPGANQLRDAAGNEVDSIASFAITNNIAAPAPATGVTMTGPTTGEVSTASSDFTVGVTPVGGTITGTVVVTPSDGGGGGTFTPTSVSLSSGSPTGTFKYTPSSSAGVRTISATNNGGLANPANISYTSTVATVSYTINAFSGVINSTLDASAANASTQQPSGTPTLRGFLYGKTGTVQYWTLAPNPASVRAGWFPLGYTPTSADFITSAQHVAAGASVNGLAPLAAVSTNWNQNGYLWIPIGSGTTVWCFWIMGVNGVPQCKNPAGMTVSNG